MGKKNKSLVIYTDGSCFNNGFKDHKLPYGGWAYLAFEKDLDTFDQHGNNPETLIHEESGGAFQTTNNRMEIEAFIHALRYIKEYIAKNGVVEVTIYADSEYVIKSVLYYIKKWFFSDWKKTDGTPVKNREQWETIHDLFYQQLKNINISVQWVKGHGDNMNNNMVDLKAKEAAEKYKEEHLEHYEEENRKLQNNPYAGPLEFENTQEKKEIEEENSTEFEIINF